MKTQEEVEKNRTVTNCRVKMKLSCTRSWNNYHVMKLLLIT